MPRVIIVCKACHRNRDFGKLDYNHVLDGFICRAGCKPTRWEKWRERRAAAKARVHLAEWITSGR